MERVSMTPIFCKALAWKAGAQPPKGGTPAVEAVLGRVRHKMIEKIGGRGGTRTRGPLLARNLKTLCG
jgi:hypothetical protein